MQGARLISEFCIHITWTTGQCHVALCVAKSRGNTHPLCIGSYECPVAGDSSSTLGFRKAPVYCVR